jgi:hypothetical protein
MVVALLTEARAQGPYALVAGRWEPLVVVVDIAAALVPQNDGTSNAVVGRVRVTPDVVASDDSTRMVPAAGLPSNVALAADGRTAWVVNHAGGATDAEVAASAHGHAGSLTALNVRAAVDPINDGTTYAMAAVIANVGVGPVGIALLPEVPIAIVSSSEGQGREDGGRQLTFVDLALARPVAAVSLALGGGGRVAQTADRACASLAADSARVPRVLPDGDVGCFPNVNGIAISRRDTPYAFTANGGTDDVAVIDIERVLAGDSGAEIARITVDVGPWGIAASLDGDYVAVANRESSETGAEGNTISILDVARAIDGDRRAEVATVIVGTNDPDEPTRPFGLAFASASDSETIVVANFRSDNVSIVDLGLAVDGRSDAEIARVALTTPTGQPARPRGVAVTPDGRYAVISGGARDADRGGWLWVVDLDGRRVAATVTEVGNEPYGVATAVILD